MLLSEVKRGDRFQIVSISDENIRVQTMRLGISEGAMVTCSEKISRGPVVIKKNLQEIALGRNLAQKITVKML